MTQSVVLHLHENEKIIMILRRHWLVYLPHIVIAFILAVVFMAIVLVANVSMSGKEFSDILHEFAAYRGLIWGVFAVGVIAVIGFVLFLIARHTIQPTRQTARHIEFFKRNWYVFIVIATLAIGFTVALGSFLLLDIISNRAAHEALGGNISDHLGRGALTIFSGMYCLSLVAYLYASWLDYYLDIFVITNRQILDIEQIILFGRKISETNFQQIQDVTSKVKGLINTLLDIGTVFIETAGEKENFSFEDVQHPTFIASTILEIQQQQWEYAAGGDEGRAEMEVKVEESSNKFSYNPNAEIPEQFQKAVGVRDNEELPIRQAAHFRGDEESTHQGGLIHLGRAQDREPQERRTRVQGGVITQPYYGSERRQHREIPDETIPEKKKVLYTDGRVILDHGVIWQSNQNLTDDIMDVLNQMDAENSR
ncbi:MAG: hypothetical protein WC045_01875 [Patescibacteria group bacterium]